MIAALYVLKDGPYVGIEGIDPWDEARDARTYLGPWPVIAHPPCARWGRYWFGGPSCKTRKTKGDDGGCFAAALAAVRQFGGVLEHPEASHAWDAFGIAKPPKSGGWIMAGDDFGGFTCCVEQGHYGHRARKATWLYVVGVDLVPLKWGPASGCIKIEDFYRSSEERKRKRAKFPGVVEARLSHRARLVTPDPFRDLLIRLANTVQKRASAAA